jgi:glucokinase
MQKDFGHVSVELPLARKGEIAVKAVDLFVKRLGRFAGDAALLFGARGGL